MPNSTLRGRFVWHELMTSDTKSAGAFYSKAIGWKTDAWPQQPSYTLFKSGKRMMAGLMVLPDDAKAMGTPPNWLTYIGTENVDETSREAVALGGKVLRQPSDIPTVGRFAVLQDPQGAVFAAFTPAPSSQAASDTADIGDFSWHELATTDWRAALSFYQRLFGWEETDSMPMGDSKYQMYGWNKQSRGGVYNKPKEMPVPAWLPYIRVPDSKKVAAAIPKLGGKVANGPMEVPGGDWIAQGIDPQGAFFAVHSVKPAVAAKTKPAAKKKAAPRRAAAKPRRAAKRAVRAKSKSRGRVRRAGRKKR